MMPNPDHADDCSNLEGFECDCGAEGYDAEQAYSPMRVVQVGDLVERNPLALPLTTEELNDLANRLVRGVTYLRFIWDAEEVRTSWMMMLAFAEEGMFTEETLECVGAFYSDMADAMPTGVNGLPLFATVKFLHVDDVDPLIDRLNEIQEFLGGNHGQEAQEA